MLFYCEDEETHEIQQWQWRKGTNSSQMIPLAVRGTNTYTKDAKVIREWFGVCIQKWSC